MNELRLAYFSGASGEAVALIDPKNTLDAVEDFAPYGMELVHVTTILAIHPPEFPHDLTTDETFERRF